MWKQPAQRIVLVRCGYAREQVGIAITPSETTYGQLLGMVSRASRHFEHITRRRFRNELRAQMERDDLVREEDCLTAADIYVD